MEETTLAKLKAARDAIAIETVGNGFAELDKGAATLKTITARHVGKAADPVNQLIDLATHTLKRGFVAAIVGKQ
jgi:hypothetical protein